ncbi:MAG: hypothetical protein ACPGGK_08200, partial [Pikeienuella sp.]
MRLTAVACALGVATLIGSGAQAQSSIACGQHYTIASGDTLQRVTRRAYGDGRSYHFIYKANRDVVGNNPSAIEIGMRIFVPCDGQQPAAAAVATPAPAKPAPAAVAAVQPAAASPSGAFSANRRDNRIRFVTANGFAPFTDDDLQNGGMVTELVDLAMKRTVRDDQYKIDFVNDWGAHFSPLLEDGHYEFGFPWYRPNCDVIEKLGENSQFRCRNLAWSDPVFEQVIGYYMRADDQSNPTTHAGLFGRTFCRPVGWATFMMEEKDLTPPRITMITPSTAAECFEALLEGRADVVVMASITADDTISKLGAGELVAEQARLSSIVKLHVVTSIDNPDKDRLMAVLNEGIQSIRSDGKWFEVVQRHLIAHARTLA